MAQPDKTWPVTTASWTGLLAALFPNQLLVNAPRNAAKDGLNASAPAVYMGDSDRIPGSRHQPGSVPAAVNMWKVKQWMEKSSLSLCLSPLLFSCACGVCVCVFLCNTAFQINKKKYFLEREKSTLKL